MALRVEQLRSESHPIEYRRILVPLVAGEASEQAVSIACQLAAEHGAIVTALNVIEVPSELPLDALMDEEEEAAKHLLAEAQAIADTYGVRLHQQVARARGAAVAVIEEAERGTEIIVLCAPRKPRASGRAPVFGHTVAHVLKNAPCRVMVVAAKAER